MSGPKASMDYLAEDVAEVPGLLRELLEETRRLRQAQEDALKVALSPAEAAARLGIGRTLAYGLIHSGDLRALRKGREYIVPVSALAELTARAEAITDGLPETVPDLGEAAGLPRV